VHLADVRPVVRGSSVLVVHLSVVAVLVLGLAVVMLLSVFVVDVIARPRDHLAVVTSSGFV
jgi:hypothetical protein